MKISIFTICTGKYNIFFEDFYKSCEKYFLNDFDKTYYVFTDGDILNSDNIVKIQQDKLGWPYDTMMRFKMFNSIKDQLNSDYTFFFNINMLFVDNIGIEVIPKEENDYLVGVNHPGYFDKPNNYLPYERNNKSVFYTPYGSGSFYYQGCFNGGRTNEFMNMSKVLEEKIDIDISNDIIPVWHDESALNWYYSSKTPLIMSPSYAYPESIDLNMDRKIIQRDKNLVGGHNFLRK